MIVAPVLSPLKEIPPADVMLEIKETLTATGFFDAEEIEWVESVITRPDGVDGFNTITGSFGNLRPDGVDLIAHCRSFLEKRDVLTLTEAYHERRVARNLLFSKRTSMYIQKRVMVLAPQRKQHPKYPAPNLHNYHGAGQSSSCAIITTYGLNYVEARNTLVRQALTDPNCSHVFFVDDDVLLPKDALKRLLDYGMPIVAGLYVKKTPALESNATTSAPDPQLIFRQQEVPLAVGNYNPVPSTCCGGGMLLISTDVLRAMPDPWFQLIFAKGGDGERPAIGEDSFFVQRAAEFGFKTHVVPGIIGVHVDFASGDCYAPHEIVDPKSRRIRNEWRERYQEWPADLSLKDLCAPDVIDWFGKNTASK